MGIYLNSSNKLFQKSLSEDIYVDKSLLIDKLNQLIGKNGCYLCISRPRRFGKSTDANMLVAYYSKGCDSSSLFKSLKIRTSNSYQKHLNQHNVIHIDMQRFLSRTHDVENMLALLNRNIMRELKLNYPNVEFFDDSDLSMCLEDIYAQIKESFIFIVDEWDCVLREQQENKDAQKEYLDYLRLLFKDQPYVDLVYMTGILPIKKYGTHSALNMFDEISMVNATPYEKFMGFTEEEVIDLCGMYNVDFSKMKEWYDGYHLDDYSIYSPKSVVSAVSKKKFDNYWTQTETYEALKIYIDLNFDGLKESIVELVSGNRVEISTLSFQNDMQTFSSKDDILTLLVHLGYLGFDFDTKEVYIPNKEVLESFTQVIKNSDWKEVTQALINSKSLLEATWDLDSDKVAEYIEIAHMETSILQYNDENALSYTISLAYIAARNHYTMIREMPSGKGFSDIVFIPKKDKPAMIIELKWKKEAETAISQIKHKKYYFGLEKYLENLLLVGISYDKETKKHKCVIEKYGMEV